MSVFSLNDISVTVALDSAYPVSLVTCHTASLFDTLAVVTVTCRPVQAIRPFNCVLDFAPANNLPIDCVLSCDYFACLSAAVCKHYSDFPFSHVSFTNLFASIADMRRFHSHDDAALIMIIDIICFLFDDRSLLYKWHGRFLELEPVLKSHGLLCDGDLLLDARRAFFHHVANGLCIYSDADGCYQSCRLSSVQISYGVFALLPCASNAVKSLACQSIGNFSDFDHQSRT